MSKVDRLIFIELIKTGKASLYKYHRDYGMRMIEIVHFINILESMNLIIVPEIDTMVGTIFINPEKQFDRYLFINDQSIKDLLEIDGHDISNIYLGKNN